ncbi:MAG: group 1 truncated hemoglobin [Hyphomicrobiales bacterium]|nr:MAG: group 1 truncated hemoglobin [Hyphomicrobiales bacterium]
MRLAPAVAFVLAIVVSALPAAAQTVQSVPAREEAVDPYTVSNANAGAQPFAGSEMLAAFHGHEGISRIVDDLVDHVQTDNRLAEIFKASDFVRLRRTLKEQVCYILNGGCEYTGRDMKKVHEDHGIVTAEFGALVEVLQDAMNREGVAFGAQNRLLAKLAPMKRDTVTR